MEIHGLPQSCHLLHADNIDVSSSHGRSCCTPDNEEGAARNRNEREWKRGQDDSDRWRRVWPSLISTLTFYNRCERRSWMKGEPADHPPDGLKRQTRWRGGERFRLLVLNCNNLFQFSVCLELPDFLFFLSFVSKKCGFSGSGAFLLVESTFMMYSGFLWYFVSRMRCIF